jgi:hypothetical protein
MKISFLLTIILFLGISGCKASNNDDTDSFIKNDFKNYLTDNKKLIIEANKNVKNEPFIKEIIFNNTFIKVRTAQSLLNDEYSDWLIGLEKNNFDYIDFNTLCWMTVYMDNYVNNMSESHRKNITEDTREKAKKLYEMKEEIIKYRDKGNNGKSLQSFVDLCE